jgi:hypothetical protein
MLSNSTLKIQGESDVVLFARNDLVQDVKITIISHPYLDDMLDKIRAKDIPWEVSLQHGYKEKLAFFLTYII